MEMTDKIIQKDMFNDQFCCFISCSDDGRQIFSSNYYDEFEEDRNDFFVIIVFIDY